MVGWLKVADGERHTRRARSVLRALLVALSWGALPMASAAHGDQPDGPRLAQAAPPNPPAGAPIPVDSRLQLLARARRWAWLAGTPDAAAVAQSPFDLVLLAPANRTIAPTDAERMRARGAPHPPRLVLAVYPISRLEKSELIAALSDAMALGVDGIVLTGPMPAGHALERVAAAARRMDPTFLLVAHISSAMPRLAHALAAVDAAIVEGAFAAEPASAVPSLIAAARASARPVFALERSAAPARETHLAERARKAGVPLYVGPPDLAHLVVGQPKP